MKYLLSLLCLCLPLQAQDIISLPAGDHVGFDVAWEGGWTGGPERKEGWRANLGTSVHIKGQGWAATRIVPATSNGTATIVIGNAADEVILEDLTVVAFSGDGNGKAIFAGNSKEYGNKVLNPKSRLTLLNCRIVCPDGAVWGIVSHNFDQYFENVVFDARFTKEHAAYVHGFADKGIYWKRVAVLGVGAEGLKVATRPFEVHWVPNAKIIVEECLFQDWKQPWSWRGGAGIVLQGCGAQQIIIKKTVMLGKDKGRCIMVDDGTSIIRDNIRFYDMDGVPQGDGFANGHIIIDRCLLQGDALETLRIGTVTNRPYKVAASLTLRNSGVYGSGIISVRGLGMPPVYEDNNTPVVDRFASVRFGIDTSVEPWQLSQ